MGNLPRFAWWPRLPDATRARRMRIWCTTTEEVPIPTRAQSRRVVSERDVVRGGCRLFLERGTVEMDALAGSLAISRATLYRVVHSRDRLLGDVLWQLGEATLTRARAQRTASG